MKAILFGPCVGEMYWEFARFAPLLYLRKQKYKDDIKMIVYTRPDRYDMYGELADIFEPLEINGLQDCFGLSPLSTEDHIKLINNFKDKYKDYEILEHLYPSPFINKCNKFYYPEIDLTNIQYFPRKENSNLVERLGIKKNIVILAPRFRKGIAKRNWPYWDKLYDLIYNDKDLMEKYEFIICGKSPDYVPDNKERFIDINSFSLRDNISLIGILIELIKRAKLTVGSQSAIPNISLLFNTPVLEWGNQKQLHTITYNPKKTTITFIDDMEFNTDVNLIFNYLRGHLK